MARRTTVVALHLCFVPGNDWIHRLQKESKCARESLGAPLYHPPAGPKTRIVESHRASESRGAAIERLAGQRR